MNERNGGAMNDIDQEVRSHLRELIDPEPVDTERALRVVVASRPSRRGGPRELAVLAAVAVLAVAVLVPRDHQQQQQQQAPPYRLVGAAGAEVVVRIDSSGESPTAEMTVGTMTVKGTEVAGTPELNGISLDEPFDPFSQPAVEVPDGSSLRVEGTFDEASASVVPWLSMTDGGDGTRVALRIGTWELDSSGGSVVFSGAHDAQLLVVDATVGGLHHYFFFRVHIVPIGAAPSP